MDRAALEMMLDDGLSLAEIGRRIGRHESTVAYWVAKHGLRAVGRERYAAKGSLRREDLEELVARGSSIAQIAESLGRKPGTVRHWLREYGLRTQGAERRTASKEGRREMTLHCSRHGSTTFRGRDDGGFRCTKCRSDAVSRRRRRVKEILVEEAGGACRLCGYARCLAALEFHHVAPSDKQFSLSQRGVARSIERARAEAGKCVLLCANCHAEVEAGVAELTTPNTP
ncbi:MAG TPA: helix-turn-helix domain-containing protein, partial [Solirubrobacteraceae bacterium]|nr:helix-turn-helix domain-containing protein [Solirubrobacteraceae bacterium]